VAGVPSERLGELFAHANPKTAFQGMDCKPTRIMVLAPAGAKGVGDFKHHLRNTNVPCPEVVYRTLSWTESSSITAVQAHLNEAKRRNMDLVVLVRGGGPWSQLRGYQREDFALAIHNSHVPVATAVGHNADVSLADRAAKLSFITPTAAADAIGTELKREFFGQKRKTAAVEGAGRKALHAAVPEEGDEAQGTIERLEANLADAWKTAAKARRDASDLAATAYRSAAVHTQDLLEAAERRIRFTSRLTTLATVAAGVALIVGAEPALALSRTATGPASYWLYIASVTSLCGALAVRQRSARRKIFEPSSKPMKHPHPDADTWRQATKSVQSIRGLRKLRHHKPL
jgi:hypothetical protein